MAISSVQSVHTEDIDLLDVSYLLLYVTLAFASRSQFFSSLLTKHDCVNLYLCRCVLLGVRTSVIDGGMLRLW